MADLRKLGKRGSYRLGGSWAARRPGADGGTRRLGRGPRRAMFGPKRSRGRLGWWAGALVAGAVVIAVAAGFGLWFAPFVIGVAIGIAAGQAGWRLRHVLSGVIVMAGLGWGVPLLWQAARGEPAGATARVIAALAGLPPHAVFGAGFTLLVASLQAVVGLWLGRAVTPHAQPR